jgi:tetratricopeptide (TPR) repeat protein
VEAELRGDFIFAERQYGRALINARLGHAPEAGISASMYGLGRMKGYLCKFEEAEPLLLEALKLEETVSGPEGGIITKRLFELARFYSDRGYYPQSIPYFARGIPAVAKLDIELSDPIAFADALDEYSIALERTGKSGEAQKFKTQATELRAKNAGRRAIFIPVRYGQRCPSK